MLSLCVFGNFCVYICLISSKKYLFYQETYNLFDSNNWSIQIEIIIKNSAK